MLKSRAIRLAQMLAHFLLLVFHAEFLSAIFNFMFTHIFSGVK